MFRIKEAANLLGVSDDTVRRWADGGRIATTTDGSGRLVIDGVTLARARTADRDQGEARSARGGGRRRALRGPRGGRRLLRRSRGTGDGRRR